MEMETTTDGTTTASTPPPPPPAPKLPPLRSILKAVKPFVGACIGATTGCSVCVLVLSRLPLGAVPAACTGPCFVGTFGNCGGLLGRTFAETTVVCTELFRQGELDVGTFLADAQLGRHLAKHEPITLEGYQFLAAPVVSQMRKSEKFTQIVSYIASPWAKYMKYLMGHSEEYSRAGHWLHYFGSPFCTIVGYGLKLSQQIKTKASSYIQSIVISWTVVMSNQIEKRQLDGVHHDTTVTVSKGSLRQALREHFIAHNNKIYGGAVGNGEWGEESRKNNVMLRQQRDGDGILSCRKCGGYSIGKRGNCCSACERMGYNGCWCRTCDCLCYNNY